ncbi:homocysteine S-methyltransferase [Sulfurospirillum sp. 1612]|uniref:homocysteine S-methyltransferase n=1 Tax=Sulfurospirillum sp. 1612 TaxID=3094835 RepID=UPI002F91E38B
MNKMEAILEKQKIMILDGATGTELERRGYDVKDTLWSAKFLMENPKAIEMIHKDYLQAGADCITTLSYQATFEGFMKRGLDEQEAKALLQSAVTLAIKVRDEFWEDKNNRVGRMKPLIAASVGPYGAYLADGSEFRGDYGLSKTELVDFHRKRVSALLETNPDLLACETVPCLIEAKAYVKLLREFPKANAWISFSAKDGKHINSGERIQECAAWLDDCEQIVAIGINCTAPEYIASLIEAIKAVSSKPIIVYPNAGEVYDAQSKSWSTKATTVSYGMMAHRWYEKGARIIGGCCQTTPEDIAQIARWVRK